MARVFEISGGRKIELTGAKIFSIDEYHLYRNNIPREVECALSTTAYTDTLLQSYAASSCDELAYDHYLHPVVSFSSDSAVMVGERFKLKDYKFCVIGEGMAMCLEARRMEVSVSRNTVYAKTLVPFYIDLWFKSLIDDNAIVLSGETFYNKIWSGEIVRPELCDTREFKQSDEAYIEIDEYKTLSKYIPALGQTEVVVPEGVCAIRSEAFCLTPTIKAQFKKITLPKSLRCIEKGSLSGIHELEEISLHPQNVAYDVKDGALYSCELVKNKMIYMLPERNKSLDTLLLYPPARTAVSQLHISVDNFRISEGAFEDCQLEKIVIDGTQGAASKHFTAIGSNTFKNCKKLSQLHFLGSKYIRFIGRNVFDGCNPDITVKFDDVTTLMTPQGLISEDAATIWYAQSDSDELIIPDGVKKLGYTMQTVPFINGIRNIGCFRKITLPQSFVTVPQHTFAACQELEEIIFSPKTKSFFDNAVNGSAKLTRLTALGLKEIRRNEPFGKPFDKTNLKSAVIGPDFSGASFFPKGTIITAPKGSSTIADAKASGYDYIEV